MRRILTLTLAFHWMCVFALLAIVCTVDPSDGFTAPLRLLGMDTRGVEQDGGSELAAFFAAAFLLVALLFFVALADLVFNRGAEAKRRPDFAAAFAAGALALTLLLLAAALEHIPYLFGTMEAVLAAILASHLAMRLDPAARVSDPDPAAEAAAVARLMALGAAHSSLMSRFSGRPAGDAPRRNT